MTLDKTKLIILPVFLYVLLKPYYLWSSGLPQISDVLFIFFSISIIYIFRYELKLKYRNAIFIFIILVFISIFVNTYYYLYYFNVESLKFPAFYLFNLVFILYIAFTQSFNIINFENFSKIAFCSFLILFVLSPFFIDFSLRQQLTFNNPNQLGVYSMMIIMINLYLASYEKRKLNKYNYFTLLMGIYFVVISFSMAAIAGVLLSIALFFFLRSSIISLFFIFCISGVFTLISIPLLSTSDTYLIESYESRLDRKLNTSKNVGFIKERGYDRIFNHPDYILFGAGEGLRYRFKSYLIDSKRSLELHSTPGSLLFSYGVFPFILLIGILLFSLKLNILWFFYFLTLIPYFLTHNMLRNPFLWLFFLLMCYKVLNKKP